jgi:hypothetical protein
LEFVEKKSPHLLGAALEFHVRVRNLTPGVAVCRAPGINRRRAHHERHHHSDDSTHARQL